MTDQESRRSGIVKWYSLEHDVGVSGEPSSTIDASERMAASDASSAIVTTFDGAGTVAA